MPNHRVYGEKKDNNGLSNGFEIIADFLQISCSKFWFNGTTSRQDLTSLDNLEALWQTVVSVAGPGAGTVAAVA
jgi:hypothetical protein